MKLLGSSDKLFSSPFAHDLLRTHKLDSLTAALTAGKDIHRRYDAKSVTYVDLNYHEKKIRVYIKRQWKQARVIPRLHSFFNGKAFKSYPLQEWQGLHHLRRLGLDTAEPLAFFRHRLNPYKAAVITCAVPGKHHLAQMIEEGALEKLQNSERVKLIQTVASVVKQIHDAGYGWRSMNIKHFYPAQQTDGTWKIWLIDCEGIFRPVKTRHLERERRTIIRLIRQSGNGMSEIGNLSDHLEELFFG